MEELGKIKKQLNLTERIVVYIFNKTIVKIYKLGITWGFNNK